MNLGGIISMPGLMSSFPRCITFLTTYLITISLVPLPAFISLLLLLLLLLLLNATLFYIMHFNIQVKIKGYLI